MKRVSLFLFSGLLLIAPQVAGARPAACQAPDIRAMTYNIRLDTPSDGANSWAFRRDEVIGQVKLLRPDIVGFQEVVPSQRRDIAAALNGYDLVGAGRDDGKDAGETSSLAVSTDRFRMGERGTFWLSPTPEVPSLGWDAHYKRVVTWAHLRDRKGGARILVLNTHWDHMGLEARWQSAGLIKSWIGSHRQSGEQVLLIGDFNATPEEMSVRSLTQGAGSLKLARDVSRSAPLGPEGTFNNFAPLPEKAARIDHIFVSADMAVSRFAVVTHNMGARVPSDHFPVVADLVTGGDACR